MAKFCTHCGSELGKNTKFCQACGTALESEKTTVKVEETKKQNTTSAPKSRIAAGLLGIFLGGLGVHNFYLGYTGKAIGQLLMSVLSCGLLSWASAIWGLIEGIMILTGTISQDANGNALQD